MAVNYDQRLMDHLFEGVYVVDKHRKIIYWNQGSERITGYTSEEVVNKFCHNNLLQHVDESGKLLCLNGCPLHHTIETGEIQQAHVFLRHKEGYRVPVSVKSLPIYDENNVIVGAVEVFTDERFQREIMNENEFLKDEIMKDPLTQIANRRFFEFSLNKKIEQFKIFDRNFGVLMFDIDHFKNVNDTYGHVVGDEILKLVAKSLVSNIKTYDVISRWGGEEFVGLFEVNNEKDLFSIAERLRNIVSKTSYIEKGMHEIRVTISIGGTMMNPLSYDRLLIEKSDQALYQSKLTGRNKTTIIE
jgi:diguanylate cyclase (GGDEF)-like protein/PAS domain S-box-containing protein